MKKIVNGQLIDISKYWDLFNRVGIDSVRIHSTSTNSLTFVLEERVIKVIGRICSVYSDIYSKIPYPLNMIENDIKYAIIAHLLHRKLRCKNEIYIDNGISISISDGIYMRLNKGSWGIVDSEPNRDKELLGLKEYAREDGYTEFIWVYKRLRDNKDTEDFYKECFPEIYNVCNGEQIVIDWELNHILNIHKIPSISSVAGRVLDIDNKEIYMVDINGDSEFIVNDSEDDTDYIEGICDRVDNYEIKHSIKVYKKKLSIGKSALISEGYTEIKDGIFDIIAEIADKEQLNGIVTNITGILYYDELFIEIGKGLYDINLTDREYKLVARGVEFLGMATMRRDRVYYKKIEHIDNDIEKESIYYYDMTDNELCSIKYRG